MQILGTSLLLRWAPAPAHYKKRHPGRMSLYRLNHSKALQRRVIRVSEMFEEHRSSGDARPEQGEWSVFP